MKRKIINSLLFIFIKIIPFSNYTPNFEKSLCEQYDHASVCVKNIIISKYLQNRGVELKGIRPINFGGFPPSITIDISPNGKKIVVKDSIGRSLWDSATGKKIITLEQPIGWKVFFSKDSSHLMMQDKSYTVVIYDCLKGIQLKELKGLNSEIITASFSHDNTQLVTSDNNGNVFLWHIATGKKEDIIAKFSGSQKLWVPKAFKDNVEYDAALKAEIKKDEYYNVVFNPDGTKLLVLGKNILLWDMINKSVYMLNDFFSANPKNVVTFSKDGKYIIIWNEGRVIIYNTIIGEFPSIIMGMPICYDKFLLIDKQNNLYMGGKDCEQSTQSFLGLLFADWYISPSYSSNLYSINLDSLVWNENERNTKNNTTAVNMKDLFNIFKSSLQENMIVYSRHASPSILINPSTLNLLHFFEPQSSFFRTGEKKEKMSIVGVSLDGSTVCCEYRNNLNEIKVTVNKLLTDKEAVTLKLIDECSDEQVQLIKKMCIEVQEQKRKMLSNASGKNYMAKLRTTIENATQREGVLLTSEEKIVFKSLHRDIQALLIRLSLVQLSWRDWLMSFVS